MDVDSLLYCGFATLRLIRPPPVVAKSLQLRVSQADNVWLFKAAEAPYAFMEDKGVGNFFGKE